MRKGPCVPMMALCLLLMGCGAGEGSGAEALLRPYREMAGCAMTAEVRLSGEDGTVGDFTLRCEYDPEGVTTVEVLAPETAAGVTAELDGEALSLRYQDLCLGAGTVSGEKLSPMECLPELMAALREGWLLAESREEVEGEPCLRLELDRTGRGGQQDRLHPLSPGGGRRPGLRRDRRGGGSPSEGGVYGLYLWGEL